MWKNSQQQYVNLREVIIGTLQEPWALRVDRTIGTKVNHMLPEILNAVKKAGIEVISEWNASLSVTHFVRKKNGAQIREIVTRFKSWDKPSK